MTRSTNVIASRPPPPPPHVATRPPGQNDTSRKYFEHSSGSRIFTDAAMVAAIRAEYPQLHLTVTPAYSCNLVAWASAGNAGLAQIDNEKDRMGWRLFIPPATRLNGGNGHLGDQIMIGKYLLDWENKEYVIYLINGRDGTEPYETQSFYILSPSVQATNDLILEAGKWNSQLHNEVWVFDQGYWQKSFELYDSVQKASWEDVILDESMKEAIIRDVDTFFDSRDTYEKLKVPWKRGVIYYGPPGNGKTVSIKAMMHALYDRKKAVPTLYVKTLSNFFGPEYAINQIFSLARREAPCYLVFEDLDSVVTDEVRSYFLNAVDGIQKNDGILMVGSTNHLDRLDPGIAKRPSRFDRKYVFPNPSEEQREAYMKYWQGKLEDNKDVEFPDKLCPAVAKITSGFSFAYLQEVMIASLLAIARDQGGFTERFCLECMEPHGKPANGSTCDRETKRPFKGLYDWAWNVRQLDAEDPDLDNYVLWREIKKQVRILREEMGDHKGDKR